MDTRQDGNRVDMQDLRVNVRREAFDRTAVIVARQS